MVRYGLTIRHGIVVATLGCKDRRVVLVALQVTEIDGLGDGLGPRLCARFPLDSRHVLHNERLEAMTDNQCPRGIVALAVLGRPVYTAGEHATDGGPTERPKFSQVLFCIPGEQLMRTRRRQLLGQLNADSIYDRGDEAFPMSLSPVGHPIGMVGLVLLTELVGDA